MSLKVTAEQARHLFDSLGYEVSSLSGKQLVNRLSSLPDLLTAGEKLEDADDLNLRDEVLEALNRGTPMELAESVETHETATATAVMEAPENGDEPSDESANGHSEPDATATPAKTKRGRKPKQAQEGTSSPHQATQKAKGAPGAFRSTQPKIFGHSAVSVAHWLGWEKFSLKDAQNALTHYGCSIKDTTLRTYLTDGRRADERYGKRAVLTLDQASELNSFRSVVHTQAEASVEV